MQLHALLEHDSLLPHTWPHEPQLLASFARLTHFPPHEVSPLGQPPLLELELVPLLELEPDPLLLPELLLEHPPPLDPELQHIATHGSVPSGEIWVPVQLLARQAPLQLPCWLRTQPSMLVVMLKH